MRKKIITTIFLSFLLAFSCSKKFDPLYILSSFPNVKMLEEKDHKLCLDMKLNIDGKENFQSPYYWQCRLAFAKYRMAIGEMTPQQSQRNMEFGDLINKISPKISQTSFSTIKQENLKLEELQHQQCLDLGFVFATDDWRKVDQYFSCRKSLIEDQKLVPPFGNQDYLKYQNTGYNLTYVINRRIEKLRELNKESFKKYPSCIQFNIFSENFKRCSKAEDASRQCYSKIPQQRFTLDWDKKSICQKEAYVKFSDDLLKKDQKVIKEKEKQKYNSDFYNKHNFDSIGIDGTLFASEEKMIEETKKTDDEEREKRLVKANSKFELYTRYELTNLRRRYIAACRENSAQELEENIANLEKECEDLRKFAEIGK